MNAQTPTQAALQGIQPRRADAAPLHVGDTVLTVLTQRVGEVVSFLELENGGTRYTVRFPDTGFHGHYWREQVTRIAEVAR